jgi:hypothetical protein
MIPVIHNYTRAVGIGLVLVLLASITGCTGLETAVDNTDGGQATVSFSEERFNLDRPVHIGIRVDSMGSYDFIWVEPDGIEGGYQINRSSDRHVLYISSDGFRTTSLGICYKPSLTSGCDIYTGDPTKFNPTVKVYGVIGDDKTLIDRYSLTTQMNEVSYSR